jgi:hypothetical protein
MHQSIRWRDLVLWLGLSEAVVYLGFLCYFVWRIVVAIT